MSITYDVQHGRMRPLDGLVHPLGRSQYVSVPGAVFPSTGDFTAEYLLEVAGFTDDDGIIASKSGGGRLYLYTNTNFGSASGNVRLWHASLGEIVVGPDIRGAGIVQLALVREGDEFRIYVDGLLSGTGSESGALGVATHSEFGRATEDTSRALEGAIYESRLWDHARSQQAMEADFFERLEGTEPGLVNLWRFDEGAGTTVADSVGALDGTAVVDNWTESTFGPPPATETGIETTHYDVTGLDPETLYRWRVRAVDGAETSDWSAWVEATTLADTIQIVLGDSFHSHISQNPSLTQSNVLLVNSSQHQHNSNNAAIIEDAQISVDNNLHNQEVTNSDLTEQAEIDVNECVHVHQSNNVILTESSIITTVDCRHNNITDVANLTEDAIITTVDSSHVVESTNAPLSVSAILQANSSLHNHYTQNASLFESASISVSDSLHEHYVNISNLVEKNIVGVSSSVHSHESEVISLGLADVLLVNDVFSNHYSDPTPITQANVTTVFDVFHTQETDSTSVLLSLILEPNSSEHDHDSTQVDLTSEDLLAVQSSLMETFSDSPELLEDAIVVVSDSLHQHLSDNSRAIFGVIDVDDRRVMVIEGSERNLLIMSKQSIMEVVL